MPIIEYVSVSLVSGSVVESVPMTVPTARFSAMLSLVSAMSVGAWLAVTLIPKGTVTALMVVAAPFWEALIVAPATIPEPPVSMSRAVSPPGVPEKLFNGTNRSLSVARRLSAAASERPDDGTLVHVVPSSTEYCQEP